MWQFLLQFCVLKILISGLAQFCSVSLCKNIAGLVFSASLFLPLLLRRNSSRLSTLKQTVGKNTWYVYYYYYYYYYYYCWGIFVIFQYLYLLELARQFLTIILFFQGSDSGLQLSFKEICISTATQRQTCRIFNKSLTTSRRNEGIPNKDSPQ